MPNPIEARNSAVISIGNEILLGKTVNSNLAWLAGELALLGLPVEYSLTVKDDPGEITNALRQCWGRFDVVLTTGGLGPTSDDITKHAIAQFFGKELMFDEGIWAHVEALFAARNLPTPQVNRNQALVPEGFTALRNDCGTAPGLYYSEGDKCLFSFAGVPLEMKHVFETQVKGILVQKYGQADAVVQKTLHTFGISESALAEIVDGSALPADVTLAWLPQTGRVDLRFYGRSPQAIEQAIATVRPPLEHLIWGVDEDSPASVLTSLLKRFGYTLSVAESCTGGLIQKLVTDLKGASEVFCGGAVTYSDKLKTGWLGVSESTLRQHGAVSNECALEMARGIKALTNSPTAISVTGVAGPKGGTETKPVGTVCFGFSVSNDLWSTTLIFNGDRETIRHKAAESALLQLVKYLQGMNI